MIINSWHLLSLLVHLAALAIWLGGMVFFMVVFAPAAHELPPGLCVASLNRGRIALQAVSWIAIGLLTITGIMNLVLAGDSAGIIPAQYYGVFLSIKLFLFFTMVVHHCLQVFKYAPQIAAITAQTPHDALVWPEALREHWRKWFMLLKINAGLSPIVVLLGVALKH